jgi:hypothetical protein
MKNRKIRLVKAPVIAFISIAGLSSFSALADQQIQDDLIVAGSVCAGLDCVNNESFGFDTVRLKENNLRIKFLDTSGSSSFPTNDWQITVNDSANGGLNKFSIDDIDSGLTPFTILAGAPANSIYVASSGNFGLGTATPRVNLHVLGNNTPTIRLDQDTSGGWAAQSWDLGGNESGFFIRDVTNSSTLPFRIIANAPNSSLYIAADGDIGFKTSTPDGLLDIAHPTNNNHAFLVSPLGAVGINIDDGKVPNGLFDIQTTAGSSLFTVNTDGTIGVGVQSVNASNVLEFANGAHLTTGGVWTNASSRKLKNNITDISAEVALNTIKALKPVTFTYKIEPTESYAGFIAEDVPEIVATNDRKSLAAMDFVAVLIKLVQEQQKAIENLQRSVEQLKQSKNMQ